MIRNISKALVGEVLTLLFLSALGSHAVAQTCVPPPEGLVSWWPGDDNADDIADGNNGALVGGATFAAGKVGQAFSFSGPGDSVNMGSPVNLQLQDFTIDAWIKQNAGGDAGIAGYGFPGGYTLILASGELVLTKNGFSHVGSGLVMGGTDWHHVAVTKSGSNVVFYLNGVASTPKSYDPGFTFESTFFIGGAFNGLIDEVEIYNRALSAAEIQAIFNAGSAGKCKVIEVTIDIKPGSFPNSINPRSRGRIRVAVLTTDTFDAATVDPTTVLFGATGTEAAPVHAAPEDVDSDGDTDLILHFNIQAIGIQCGDTSASLTGETFGGQAMQGTDSVNTVGCK